MKTKIKGFYTDDEGRVRPITSKQPHIKPLAKGTISLKIPKRQRKTQSDPFKRTTKEIVQKYSKKANVHTPIQIVYDSRIRTLARIHFNTKINGELKSATIKINKKVFKSITLRDIWLSLIHI